MVRTFCDGLPSSPSPFSQNWEKGSRSEVPLPELGEGFRERANITIESWFQQWFEKLSEPLINNIDW
jgi:hypothetical protein